MTDKNTPGSIIWKNIFRDRKEDNVKVPEVLKKVPVFSELNAREISKLASIVHLRSYNAGETVFLQGDPGLGMYVIEKGQVSIRMITDSGDEKELSILTDGDFFGELSLLDESPRSASAVAVVQSKIIGFFRPDLFELLNRSPRIGIKVLLKLSETIGTRLRLTNNELTRVAAELQECMAKQRRSKK
ncbi:MAG: cyclic nucleotide-binding domain-containing protein [Candidatus Kryptoniota bacterium]